jgi:GH15 family glucan-1,4-alpha-glucosidase
MVEAVSRRWKEPDNGIWEVRGDRRHHVHSKLMCWLAAERGARIAQEFLGEERPQWKALADEIRADILANGIHPERGAFTVAYGSGDLDASTLLVGLKGLVPPDHPAFVRTVELVEQELRRGPTVYRYHYEDALPGFEGGFHICTAWLIEALWMIGRQDDARALLDEMVELIGPTGLLSEQYGALTRRALGNHPQAYSHLGFIDAVLRLEDDVGA